MLISEKQIMRLMQIAQHYHGDICMRQFDDDETKEFAEQFAHDIRSLLNDIAFQQPHELIEVNNVVDLKVVK